VRVSLDQGILAAVKVITMLPCNGKTSVVRGERMEAVTLYFDESRR
jgi:hypothetical protein